MVEKKTFARVFNLCDCKGQPYACSPQTSRASLWVCLSLGGGADAAIPTAPFYFGADLSYVNEMEDCGAKYRAAGTVQDPYALFKAHGFNLVRVRLWNNPD